HTRFKCDWSSDVCSSDLVDNGGGCNPLDLVVSAVDGSLLNTDAAYEKMWKLHGALENYKDVGTVISLPTLLAEGDRTPFSFLLKIGRASCRERVCVAFVW